VFAPSTINMREFCAIAVHSRASRPYVATGFSYV
jgi:hypothetical protein